MLESLRTKFSIRRIFCDLSLVSFDAVTSGITVAVTGIPAIDNDPADADAGDDDIVVFDDVTDEHGVIVLDNDSDDDAGVVCKGEVSTRGFKIVNVTI